MANFNQIEIQSCAHAVELNRTRVGEFTEKNALTSDQACDWEFLEKKLYIDEFGPKDNFSTRSYRKYGHNARRAYNLDDSKN